MNIQKYSKKSLRLLVIKGIIILLLTLTSSYVVYFYLFKPNFNIPSEDGFNFYIPTGAIFGDVVQILDDNKLVKNTNSFKLVAKYKNYPNKIFPGRYIIKKNWGNNKLINKLRSGRQDPIRLTINAIRFKEQLSKLVSKKLEADAPSISALLNNQKLLGKFDMDTNTIISMFIPNTYELYWNTNAQEFIERMYREYKKFWNNHRKEKLKQLGLSQIEVSTLASIIEEETNKNDEKPLIAGVYINRLKKGMRLQSDPTLKFALKDYTRKRILYDDLKIKSAYNTYKYRGLPPGPICIPSIKSIDAVLNYKKHNYLFFCASADTIGYHTFTVTFKEHKRNARKYQKYLNKRNIYK